MRKKILGLILAMAVVFFTMPPIESFALVDAGFITNFHLGNKVNSVYVDGIVIDWDTGETTDITYTNGQTEYLTTGTEIRMVANLESGYKVGAVLSNRDDIEFKITDGKRITFTVPDVTGWDNDLDITILSDMPEKPINLSWDGTTAKWENPNDPSVVGGVNVYLYNTKNTDDCANFIGFEPDVTEYDFADDMIPGDTYYFEVGIVGKTGKYTDEARSANYTVPGSYTIPAISNLKLDISGKMTWDAAKYVEHYEGELYVKNGESWDLVDSDNYIFYNKTSYDWASKVEPGKTYKVSLVAKQLNIIVANKSESAECQIDSNIQNVKISSDGKLTWDAFSGASSYNIDIGVAMGNTSYCNYDIKDVLSFAGYTQGTFTIHLYAIDDEKNRISEIWEGTYIYENTNPKLETPTNITWNGRVVSWDPVANATKYSVNVYVNGSQKSYESVKPRFDVSSIVSCGDECYVRISAIGKYYPASDSGYSETISVPHNWKEGIVTKPASFAEEGLIERSCECGAVDTQTIPCISSVELSTGVSTYNGKVKSPSIIVTDTEISELVKGTDYTVTIPSGRKNVGTYAYKVTFKGNYSGSKSVSFKINPATASIKSITPGTKKMTVKMTTKPSSKGASTYQIYYKQKGTSKWKSTTTTAQSKTIKKLKKGKKYYVKVRAYKKVGTTTYYGAWSKTKLSTKIK